MNPTRRRLVHALLTALLVGGASAASLSAQQPIATVAGGGTHGHAQVEWPPFASIGSVDGIVRMPRGGGVESIFYVSSQTNRVYELRNDRGHVTVQVVAGTGFAGFDSDYGPVFDGPSALVQGPHFPSLLVADSGNNRVRLLHLETGLAPWLGSGACVPGELTLVAVEIQSASLCRPTSMALFQGQTLYVVDSVKHALWRVDPLAGTARMVFVDTDGQTLTPAARLAVGSSGELVYVSVPGRIAAIDLTSGTMSTLVTTASIPWRLAPIVFEPSSSESLIYPDLVDGELVLQRLDLGTLTATPIAGGGSTAPPFNGETAASRFVAEITALSGHTNHASTLDIGQDGYLHALTLGGLVTTAGDGTVSSCGDGGPATAACLNQPASMIAADDGTLLIADAGNHRLRAIDASGIISSIPVLLDPSNPDEIPKKPTAMARDSITGDLYVSSADTNRIYRLPPFDPQAQLLAGTGTAGFSGDGGDATLADLDRPMGLAFAARFENGWRRWLYFADAGNGRIRRIDLDTNEITTVVTSLDEPVALSYLGFGCMHIAERSGHRVRRICPSDDGVIEGGASESVETVAGTGEPGFNGDGIDPLTAQLSFPSGVGVSGLGTVLIADAGNLRVRAVDSSSISTIAGGGFRPGDGMPATETAFGTNIVSGFDPAQSLGELTLAVTPGGNEVLYIADKANHRIRSVCLDCVDNRPPIALAGDDRVIRSNAPIAVHLDGTASSDPDGDALSFEWTEGSVVLGSTSTIDPVLGLGRHTITLIVIDSHGSSAADTVEVLVEADADPAPLVVEFREGIVVTDTGRPLPSRLLALDEGIRVDDAGRPLPSRLLSLLENIQVADTGRPLPSRLLWLNEGIQVADSGRPVPRPPVAKVPTALTIATSRNPSITTAPPVFTATIEVQSPWLLTGQVEFSADGVLLCRSTVFVRSSAYVASCGGATLAVGSHTITARYPGDTRFEGSDAAAIDQDVREGTYVAVDLGMEGAAVAISPNGRFIVGNSPVDRTSNSWTAFFYDVSENSSLLAFDASGHVLPTLGGAATTAVGVDDAGTIAGTARNAQQLARAFVFTPGSSALSEIHPFGGPISSATGIRSGRIVGFAGTDTAFRAFAWAHGEATDLGTLGGASSMAFAISDTGLIVGAASTPDGSTHAAIFSQTPPIDLGTLPGGQNSVATSVNNAGEVAGSSDIAGVGQRALLYRNGALVDLTAALDVIGGAARRINDAGEVVGSFDVLADPSQEQTETVRHIFLSRLGVLVDLGVGDAADISNSGQFVGTATGAVGPTAFVHNGLSGMTLGPANGRLSQAESSIATAINDRGEIVGSIVGATGGPRATLWKPVGIGRLTVAPASGRASDSIRLSAHLQSALDETVAEQLVSFSVDGEDAGTGLTDAAGNATSSPFSLSAFAHGVHPGVVTATFRGDAVAGPATAIGDLTVRANAAPVLTLASSAVIEEGQTLVVSVASSDPDGDPVSMTLSRLAAGLMPRPSFAHGVFTWAPSEAQGPGTYLFTIHAEDNQTPPATVEAVLTVIVIEVNLPPAVSVPSLPSEIDEGVPLAFTASAADPDVPEHAVTFSLVNAPGHVAEGAPTIDAATGAFTWTPNPAHAGQTFTFRVAATDSGVPPLTGDAVVTVTVRARIVEEIHVDDQVSVNGAPLLAALPNLTVEAGQPVSFVIAAVDDPADALQFSIASPATLPDDARLTAIDGHHARFTWTPADARAGTDWVFAVRVSDAGSPPLADAKSFTIHVKEKPIEEPITVNDEVSVNAAPMLDAITDQTVTASTALSFIVTAMDSAADTLTFGFANAVPASAQLTAVDGHRAQFTWTPTHADVGRAVTFSIRATDNGTPPLASNDRSFTVTVLAPPDTTPPDTTPPAVTAPAAITIPATEAGGARPSAWPALAAFLAGGTATDLVDPAPVRLDPQIEGLTGDDPQFPIGRTTTVIFQFRDAAGNVGTASSTVTVILGTPRIAMRIARNGTMAGNRKFLDLELANTGTGNARQLALSILLLLPTRGVGIPRLVSPKLPISIGALDVGSTTVVRIVYDVPPTVREVSILAAGTFANVRGTIGAYLETARFVP